MATGFEGVGLKAVIDALVSLFARSQKKRLTAQGKKALEEAMKELLMAPKDLRSADAKLRIAKAAGIINEDVELAEEWLNKHKAAKRASKRKVAKKRTSKRSTAKKK